MGGDFVTIGGWVFGIIGALIGLIGLYKRSNTKVKLAETEKEVAVNADKIEVNKTAAIEKIESIKAETAAETAKLNIAFETIQKNNELQAKQLANDYERLNLQDKKIDDLHKKLDSCMLAKTKESVEFIKRFGDMEANAKEERAMREGQGTQLKEAKALITAQQTQIESLKLYAAKGEGFPPPEKVVQ